MMAKFIVEQFYSNGRLIAEYPYACRDSAADIARLITRVTTDAGARDANGLPSLVHCWRISAVSEETHTWAGGACVVELRDFLACGIGSTYAAGGYTVRRDYEAAFDGYLAIISRATA